MAKPKEPTDDMGLLIELGAGDKSKDDGGGYDDDPAFMAPAKKAVGSEAAARALKEAMEACLEAHGLLKATEDTMDESTGDHDYEE